MPSERDTSENTEPQENPPKDREPKTKRSDSAVPQGVVNRASKLAMASFRSSVRLAMLGPRTLMGRDDPKKLMEELHAATAQELLETLGRLKGASMKVGQLASFIDTGVLPPEVRDTYQSVLGSLRDAAPPMKPELVDKVLRREFDASAEELFATFDHKPVAAASLGQVHAATLHDGRRVAVKIQYPGIEDAIRSDMTMTAAVKPLMPLLAPGLEADEAIAEIRRRVLEECDYLLEAEHLDTLADSFDDHPFVYVPRSIPDRSTKRILTMEYADGSTFDELKVMDQKARDRAGEIIFRFYYGALHRYGFTSADPHPGNYRMMDDGRMAFYDFGLAFELDPGMRPHMLRGLLALRDGDVEGLFDHAVQMRFIRKPEEIDPERFFEWVSFSLTPIATDAEYTFTRDFIAQRTAAMMDPRNPWWGFLRKLNLPRWAILQYRLELGMFAVLAQLNATANWHKITMEFYGEHPASTPLGAEEALWLDR